MFLYSYAPEKIYDIENILLIDAIHENDDDKIVKLSNLMLQGALISSNYTNALGLLYNILSRMKNPTLIVNGEVNSRFLLLSLVRLEILYNVGDYLQCAELAEEILQVINPEIIDKIKPASFSTNLFVNHIIDTLRLGAFAKLQLLDDDLEDFFIKVQEKLSSELPEKGCILAIRDYLAGKPYSTGTIEECSSLSKVVFLILQEFSSLKDDYKVFAQNIYQAKLLASDIHQKELELLCDLLIGYAYAESGAYGKAEAIYNDILSNAENKAMFGILLLSRYFMAKLYVTESKTEKAMLLINDSLAMLQKHQNKAKIIFALFEKLYIDTAKSANLASSNIDSEEQKLAAFNDKLAFTKL